MSPDQLRSAAQRAMLRSVNSPGIPYLSSREQQCQGRLQLGLKEPQNTAAVLQTRALYIAQAGLDLVLFLPLCWDCRTLHTRLSVPLSPQKLGMLPDVPRVSKARRAARCSQRSAEFHTYCFSLGSVVLCGLP